MNRVEALPDWARELLERGRVARLGLLDADGRPRVLPICFAVEAGSLWSAIDRKPKADPASVPARVGYLLRNPAVAVTVDHYEEDWSRLGWVQLLGRVEVIGGDSANQIAAALDSLAAKYPQYRTEPPPGPVLRIEVDRALCWKA